MMFIACHFYYTGNVIEATSHGLKNGIQLASLATFKTAGVVPCTFDASKASLIQGNLAYNPGSSKVNLPTPVKSSFFPIGFEVSQVKSMRIEWEFSYQVSQAEP